LSPRTFCPHGRFVHGRFVSGHFVSGRFVWAPKNSLAGWGGAKNNNEWREGFETVVIASTHKRGKKIENPFLFSRSFSGFYSFKGCITRFFSTFFFIIQ
jgi:hypothetical protein